MYVAPHFVVKSGVHLSLKTQLNMSFVADEHAPECQTKIVNQPTAFNPEPTAVPAPQKPFFGTLGTRQRRNSTVVTD